MVNPTQIEARNLPRHVAIIMDGNGRWAEQRGFSRTEGHRRGSDAVRRVVRAARRLGVEALTLFAFSEQNWARPQLEVQLLMGLLREFLVSERGEILENGIRLRAIGDLTRLPTEVRRELDPLQNDSASNGAMTLTLALSYGGREEIADAAKDLARAVAAGQLDPENITPELLQSRIASVAVGDPDLLVRTGGELRISNFLLWGAAYSELHFTQKLWPDFEAEDLYRAVAAYQSRERRFGLTGGQVRNLRAAGSVSDEDVATLVPVAKGYAHGGR
ncbi:MAG: polyprenyl diphosphate synthase [Deltaproteobacteria bacterium]|nr:polyprenyl diphosphate synthase [Deltaproteobacteria bacterium]